MTSFLYIYLAGNIRKGKEDDLDEVWTEKDMEILQTKAKRRSLVFLNPAHRSDDLSDQKSVFGRDLFQVFSSDAVLVDLRSKRGLGVGAEMMFAKMHHIPVIGWLPENSHYQRKSIHYLGQQMSAWIHPFVYNLTDYIAPSLEHAARWIDDVMLSENFEAKGPESLSASINHYLETQLERDKEMHRMVSSHTHFEDKIDVLRLGC